MQKMISLSFVILFLFAIGCSGSRYTAPSEYTVEKERVINKSFESVWQASVEYFATHNIPIKNIDKSSGFISTEFSLSINDAAKYIDCGKGDNSFSGKIEVVNPVGNFNFLAKSIDDKSTKVSINSFFSSTVNQYKYEGLLSTNYVLVGSTKTECKGKGVLEKEIFDYLSK